MKRVKRDFQARPEMERQCLLADSWCDRCAKADLGMESPQEYEECGRVYVSGNCKVCGEEVRSEVIEEDAG